MHTQSNCTHHDNFARSLPNALDQVILEAVVDHDLLNEIIRDEVLFNSSMKMPFHASEVLADFKAQVQQWIAFEKQQIGTGRETEAAKLGTVFIVWFSLWDVWYLSGANLEMARTAIRKTLDVLFEQLDTLAENWSSKIRVIMPEAVDITFLPAWSRTRTTPGGSDLQAVDQRNAVLLVEQWNHILDRRASRWSKGDIYIYNINDWLLDQIRQAQLASHEMVEYVFLCNTCPLREHYFPIQDIR